MHKFKDYLVNRHHVYIQEKWRSLHRFSNKKVQVDCFGHFNTIASTIKQVG